MAQTQENTPATMEDLSPNSEGVPPKMSVQNRRKQFAKTQSTFSQTFSGRFSHTSILVHSEADNITRKHDTQTNKQKLTGNTHRNKQTDRLTNKLAS